MRGWIGRSRRVDWVEKFEDHPRQHAHTPTRLPYDNTRLHRISFPDSLIVPCHHHALPAAHGPQDNRWTRAAETPPWPQSPRLSRGSSTDLRRDSVLEEV